jgi:hypothetical protein
VAAPGCLRASEQATTDARQRLAALRRACATYSGDLAQDHNYEWITPTENEDHPSRISSGRR